MLTFIGRLGPQSYVEETEVDGKKTSLNKTRESQKFKAGIMKVRGEVRDVEEKQFESIVDDKGNPMLASDGTELRKEVTLKIKRAAEWVLKPTDIGKTLDGGVDEAYLLKQYPQHFKKA